MERLERIAVLENYLEAELLGRELEAREIPHVMRSYHDSAYDGIYQFQKGWGEVQAPEEFREEILAMLRDFRETMGSPADESEPRP